MKAVIQRVTQAGVTCSDHQAKIGKGLLILLGVAQGDTKQDARKLAQKILKLRIMPDSQDKMNLSVKDVKGELLVVSQFTLLADTSQGNRPSFLNAAKPKKAKQLYQHFVKLCQENISTKTGLFGDYMSVNLTNDGPVTITLNSHDL